MTESHDERRSHHFIFTAAEPDLSQLRATPDLRALLDAGWQIVRYEVVPLEDRYAVTVIFCRPRR